MTDMHLKELQKHWHAFGKIDPCWAILAWSNKKGNQWQKDEFFRTGAIEVEAVMQAVEALNISVKRGKALDFGCGVGRLTQALAQYFDEAHGVDISPSMIDTARAYSNNNSKCIYYLNESDNLKIFANNSFDFIYTSFVLQHMESSYAKKYIKEFLRVLAPHGLLVFQLPEPLEDYAEKPYNKLKRFIRNKTPWMVLDFYRSLYKKKAERSYEFPIMETHGIKRKDVTKLLDDNDGKIIDIRDYIESMIEFFRGNTSKFAAIIKTMPEEMQMIIGGAQPVDVTADVQFRYGISFWYFVTKE